MIRRILYLLFAFFIVCTVSAQSNDLHVREWKSTPEKPLVLFICGDGGINAFTTGLCNTMNTAGYSIAVLNSKSYFWSKKTPEETTSDISDFLEKELQNRANRQFILAGYSFGADIIPFIINRLPVNLKTELVSVVLLSPSGSTDFEVHYSDMLGIGKKRDMDVISEVNRMGSVKIAALFSSDDHIFPPNDIYLKNYSTETLPGGHHFEGNSNQVANSMMKYFK